MGMIRSVEAPMTHEEFTRVKPLLDQVERAAEQGKEASIELVIKLVQEIPSIRADADVYLRGEICTGSFLIRCLEKVLP